MTHDTKKDARQFWIIREKGFSTWVSDKPLFSADTTEEIHVIEYSYVQKLEAENLVLRRNLELFESPAVKTLTAENQKLKAALNKIAMSCAGSMSHTAELQEFIEQTCNEALGIKKRWPY